MSSARPKSLAAEHLDVVLAKLAGADAVARDDQLEAVHAIIQPAARVLVVQATGWGKSAVYWAATSALRLTGLTATLTTSIATAFSAATARTLRA